MVCVSCALSTRVDVIEVGVGLNDPLMPLMMATGFKLHLSTVREVYIIFPFNRVLLSLEVTAYFDYQLYSKAVLDPGNQKIGFG